MDRSAAYYHYTLGHLYGELAGAYQGRSDYLNKAIENYRLAMKDDSSAGFIAEELSDLYIQSGRLREGVIEAEEAIKQNPNDLNSRRVLGRIYMRMIGDVQQGKIDEGMLNRAIDQYQKISEKAPNDVEVWLTLGRLYKVAQKSPEAQAAYKKALGLDANNEDALTGLAMVYIDLGQNKEATDLLTQVAGKNPSLRTLTALAGTYEQMREYALAAATLQKAIELAPNGPNVQEMRRLLAQDLLLAERYPEALKLYQEFLQEDPKDVQSQLRIAQIYRQQRDFAKAREATNKAKEIDPNSSEVRYNEVGLLEAEGKTKEAIAALKEILSSTAKRTYSPPEKANRVVFLERLGMLQRSADMYSEAAETFRQIGTVDADLMPRALAQVVETYRQGKDYNKALAEADAGIKTYPNDRTLHLERAALLSETGKSTQAVAELRKLLDGRGDRDIHIAIAQAFDKAKNYPEMSRAIDEAEKLSTSKDEKESIYFMRGAMLEKQKKFDAAEAEFRKVLDMNPQSASAMNYLGYMLADRNTRLPEAQQLISKALELDPNNGAYLDSLGWVYYRQGKLPEAESTLRKAIEQFSKDPTVHDHLGDVYFSQGKLREAINQWESSLKEYETAAAADQDPNDVAKIQGKLEKAKVRLAREAGPANKSQVK